MGESLPLVTIVTPSLNQGRFIRQTIESVLGQDYPRIEHLVMDGGSTDETLSILREYSGRIRWISEPDRGQAAAINNGWRCGSGKILAWLNSDDVYRPGAVGRAVSYLSRHPDVGAVYGEGYHINEAGGILERYPAEPFDLDRLKETCFICQPTVFMRREVVEQVGYLDESLRYCMDYDLWFRIGKVAPFDYMPEDLAMSRLYADTKTLGRRREVYAEVLHMLHRHFGCVRPSWIYAYAKAVAETSNPRGGRWDQARFLVRLTAVGLRTFFRYNRRAPFAELLHWQRSWGRAWRAAKREVPGVF